MKRQPNTLLCKQICSITSEPTLIYSAIFQDYRYYLFSLTLRLARNSYEVITLHISGRGELEILGFCKNIIMMVIEGIKSHHKNEKKKWYLYS